MEKPTIENLRALVYFEKLTLHQHADAVNEFQKLDKCTDQLEEEKKDLSKALKCIANLSEDAHTPLLKAVHQIAFKTLRL